MERVKLPDFLVNEAVFQSNGPGAETVVFRYMGVGTCGSDAAAQDALYNLCVKSAQSGSRDSSLSQFVEQSRDATNLC